MKIIKQANGYDVKLSFKEWKAMGTKAGWFKVAQNMNPEQPSQTPNPAPAPVPAQKPRPLAQEMFDFGGGDLEQDIEAAANESVSVYTTQESDGIGTYEFWGHQGYDRGSNYPSMDTFSMAVDLTGTVYDEYGYADWENSGLELPSASGNAPTQFGDVSWSAQGSLKQFNGKTYGFFTVQQVS